MPPPGSWPWCRRSRPLPRAPAAGRHPAAPTGGPKVPSPSGSKRPLPSAVVPVVSSWVTAHVAAAPPTAPRPRPTTRATAASPRPPLTRERQDFFSAARHDGRRHGAIAATGTGRADAAPSPSWAALAQAGRRLADAGVPTAGCSRVAAAGMGWVGSVRWLGHGGSSRRGDDLGRRSGRTLWLGCGVPSDRLAVARRPLTGTAQGTHGLASVRTPTMST